MNLAPIVLFTYNRLNHTQQTVAALQKNHLALESNLYIYSDGPKNDTATESVTAVRSYLKTITGFQSITIIERDTNWGLADSIVDGVTTVVQKYGKIIVLEDDIVTSPLFLQYMNDALALYEKDKQVMHISGYFYPVATNQLPDTFFYNQTSCWGWSTWASAWSSYNGDAKELLGKITEAGRLNEFDMDGNFKFSSTLRANIRSDIKTWAIKWHASVFIKQGLCLHPKLSLTQNIGNDGTGTNAQQSNRYNTDLEEQIVLPIQRTSLKQSNVALGLVKKFLKATRPSMIQKIINKVWK